MIPIVLTCIAFVLVGLGLLLCVASWRNPQAGPGWFVTGIALAIVGAFLTVGASDNHISQQAAVNAATAIDPVLGKQVQAAQNMTNDEAGRTGILAGANLNNAQANFNNTLAHSLDDDRKAKQIGYGGLMIQQMLDYVGGAGGLLFLLGCPAGLLLFTGFALGRKSKR